MDEVEWKYTGGEGIIKLLEMHSGKKISVVAFGREYVGILDTVVESVLYVPGFACLLMDAKLVWVRHRDITSIEPLWDFIEKEVNEN